MWKGVHGGMKECLLYDRECIECGECLRCDLDPDKLEHYLDTGEILYAKGIDEKRNDKQKISSERFYIHIPYFARKITNKCPKGIPSPRLILVKNGCALPKVQARRPQ